MERLSQNSEVTHHGHVVDKQPGQGVDPDLMTDTMSSALSSTPWLLSQFHGGNQSLEE